MKEGKERPEPTRRNLRNEIRTKSWEDLQLKDEWTERWILGEEWKFRELNQLKIMMTTEEMKHKIRNTIRKLELRENKLEMEEHEY